MTPQGNSEIDVALFESLDTYTSRKYIRTIKRTEHAMSTLAARPAVTAGFVGERLHPYRVRMTCGHVVVTLMRPSTAGVPWTPEAEVAAPYNPCRECQARR
jgi:hypothetical protein